MNRNHSSFFRSQEGREFERIIRKRSEAYAAMSLQGQPAICAAVPELDVEVERLPAARRPFVKQACGALVGNIITSELGGRRAVSKSGQPKSGRIKGSRYFTTGAIWDLSKRRAIDVRSLSDEDANALIALLQQQEQAPGAEAFDHEMDDRKR
jgi:hypothetical protein